MNPAIWLERHYRCQFMVSRKPSSCGRTRLHSDHAELREGSNSSRASLGANISISLAELVPSAMPHQRASLFLWYPDSLFRLVRPASLDRCPMRYPSLLGSRISQRFRCEAVALNSSPTSVYSTVSPKDDSTWI